MAREHIIVYDRAENNYFIAAKDEGDFTHHVIAGGLSYEIAAAIIGLEGS